MSTFQKPGRRAFLALGLAAFAGLLSLQASAAITAGKDYIQIKPQPTSSPGKVEVTEFFSYGCSHCNDLEPLFENWMSRAPKDVVVKRIPVAFSSAWVPLQKLYYSLQAMGLNDKLDKQVFDAIHRQGVRMVDEEVMLNWVATHGVDRKKFQNMYNSFSVQSEVQRAQQLTREYNIMGVPTLAVAGRYLTSASYTQSHEAALAVLDQLVVKARGEMPRR